MIMQTIRRLNVYYKCRIVGFGLQSVLCETILTLICSRRFEKTAKNILPTNDTDYEMDAIFRHRVDLFRQLRKSVNKILGMIV